MLTYQTAEHHNHKQLKEDIQFIQPLFVLNKHDIPELEATIAIRDTEFKIRTNLLSKENLGYI